MIFDSFLVKSNRDVELSVARSVFVDTYLGLPVMVRNPQFWVVSSFFQWDLEIRDPHAWLPYVVIGLMYNCRRRRFALIGIGLRRFKTG